MPGMSIFQLAWAFLFSCVTCSYGANDLAITRPLVHVSKCCSNELLLNANFQCQHVNKSDSQPWEPYFHDEHGHPNVQIPGFQIKPGFPDCGSHQALQIFETSDSTDKLYLLSSGFLRHFIHPPEIDDHGVAIMNTSLPNGESSFHDYHTGSYCLDKTISWWDKDMKEIQVAVICVPVVTTSWSVDFIVRKIVNPCLHLFGIGCLLAVAVVYFILPPLRDLVGNILSTISVCLIVSQTADLVLIFTEFTNHVSFLVADVVMYFSLLASFFWLNSFGYYIWKTFRSRNVFLRVSDGRKYCYYSCYAWGATLLMTLVALISHFLFDESSGFPVSPHRSPLTIIGAHDQPTIGWLGIAMFFTPIACTILVDLYFYLTTGRVISRMATYGRIHGRMKFSFELFIQMFLVMSVGWLFLLLSWLQYDVLVYANIVVNALQPLLILVICVVGRKNVRSLLRKGCCRGEVEPQWGEEMMSMTSN